MGSVAGAPVVVYIAGYGRSGSTLLERALGEMPGYVNVGEMIDLYRRVIDHDERCGCGEAFSACPFWTAVGHDALGGWDSAASQELRHLRSAVVRQRHLAHLLSPVQTSAFRSDTARYRELHARLYGAALAHGDAQVVVDASKWPAQAAALHGEEVDVRVLHLVRDVRGVARSMTKQGVARPHATGTPDVMSSQTPVRVAAQWTLVQTEIDLLRTTGLPVHRMQYEDFVDDPHTALSVALDALDLPRPVGWSDHIDERRLRLSASHGLSGNPSRFVVGEVTLRADNAWRSTMTGGTRALVTAVAAPQLAMTAWRRPPRRSPSTEGRTVSDTIDAEPLVTVLVATRGRPELVRETLQTIVAQDYPGPMEILVVHDQEEPDPGLVDLGGPQRQVSVMSNLRRPGLAGARNTGLGAAKGDFIATCDDDDLWHPDKIRRQVDLMQHEPDLLVVGAGIRLLFPKNRVVDWPGRSARIDQETLLRNRVKELHSSTLLMRRDAFAKAGHYNEDLPHGYAEDYDWVLRAARVGTIGVVIEPLADIRKDVQSWYRGRAENTAEALQYFLDIHPEIQQSRRGYARILGQIAYAQATMGDRRTALHNVGRSLRQWPAAPHAYLALTQATVGLDPRVALKLARVFRRGLS